MRGPTLDEVLDELGIGEDVHAMTEKRIIAMDLAGSMKARKVSKSEMAAAMKTSRTQIERLLDPTNDRVQLDTVMKAARYLGRRMRISFEPIEAATPDGKEAA